MNINQFMNNNEFALSIISQYVGPHDKLTYSFNKEILKEYNEMKFNVLLINKLGIGFNIISNNFINNKYYKLTKMSYNVIHENMPGYPPNGGVYFNCRIEASKDWKLPKTFCKNVLGYIFNGTYVEYWLSNDYDEPPNIILQHTYFD